MIGVHVSAEQKGPLAASLQKHNDVFAWTYADKPGINPEVIAHRLNVLPGEKGKV